MFTPTARKSLTIGTAPVLFAFLLSPLSAVAKPDQAASAEVLNDGLGCQVTEDGVLYQYDSLCDFDVVTKTDKDGNLKFFHYKDHGSLQAGQVAPQRTIVLTTSYPDCELREVITPSGNYSSSKKCKY